MLKIMILSLNLYFILLENPGNLELCKCAKMFDSRGKYKYLLSAEMLKKKHKLKIEKRFISLQYVYSLFGYFKICSDEGGGVRTNDLGLTKFIVFRSTTLGCKDIRIRKS